MRSLSPSTMHQLSRLACLDAAIIFVLAQVYRSPWMLCSLVFPLVGYHGAKTHCVVSLLVYGAFCAGVLWSTLWGDLSAFPLLLRTAIAVEETWLLLWISWSLRRATTHALH